MSKHCEPIVEWDTLPKILPHWHDEEGEYRLENKVYPQETVLTIEASDMLSMQAIETDASILVHLPPRVRLCRLVDDEEVNNG